jgi:prepilin-type N-terminal cleavage/methylation domain-containing protein
MINLFYVAGMTHGPQQAHLRSGFTLIELSMVLVIIGLIVGAIFVGREMIKAAEIRAQVSQIEKYKSAVNTFRIKYGYLPGDIPADQASQIGLATRAVSALVGASNGDGLIEANWVGNINISVICGEVTLFWNDLSTVGLIEGQYVGMGGTPWAGNCTTASTSDQAFTIIPAAKIGSGNGITVFSDSNTNYFMILANVARIDTIGRPYDSGGNLDNNLKAITPFEALAIDTKMDDGQPLTGIVTARGLTAGYNLSVAPSVRALATPAAPATGVCVSNASGNPYNVNAATGGASPACTLQLRFN